MIIAWLHQQSYVHVKDTYTFFSSIFFSNINFSSLKLPEDLNMGVSACSEELSETYDSICQQWHVSLHQRADFYLH